MFSTKMLTDDSVLFKTGSPKNRRSDLHRLLTGPMGIVEKREFKTRIAGYGQAVPAQFKLSKFQNREKTRIQNTRSRLRTFRTSPIQNSKIFKDFARAR
jgi:hypothetical protein